MYNYEATTLPGREPARHITQGGVRDEREARAHLARALVSAGLHERVAAHIASTAEQVFTDFPEYGVTARVYS